MNELPFGTTRCPKCAGVNYSGMPICSSCTRAEADERRAAVRAEREAKFAATSYKPYAARPFTPRAAAPVAPVRKAWNEMTRKERLSVELASIRRSPVHDDDNDAELSDRAYGQAPVLTDAERAARDATFAHAARLHGEPK